MNLDNAKTVPCHRQWPPRPQTTSNISEPGHTPHPRLGTIPGATSTAGRTTGARNRQHSARTHQPRSQTSAALWTHRLCHPRLATGSPVQVPATLFTTNLHRARRGAAPGPSGLTAEIAKILLDDPPATQVCGRLAQANVPPAIAQAFGLGRLVALRKPSRGAGAVEETYCTPHFALNTPSFPLYTPHSTLYTPHATLYTVHSTL